ncbi:methyl-CpG-binding domain-containing protein 7-like [Quercus lobata]|uniref:MBD domain-containing protein n=1 Tax=Quercus lobata TaxID=97700 RepID=A0A7N2KPI4_QUELO|nr:methyl-CpG-binding domain-containing protein 7-like [Quercus lobata]
MRGKSSPSTPTPLQMLSPPESESDTTKRELQIASTSPFRLPDDWFVEFKTRRNNTASPGRVDKYYHEPGTGRMFRSLIAVKRYLTEENQYTPTPTPETVKAGNENTMQIVVRTIKSTSHFKLPDDWVIEEKPRSNANYAGIIDKYYIEPGTGQRFRSLVAVERYLTQANENTATPKALKPGNQTSHYSGLRKKNISSDIYSLDVLSKDLEDEEDTVMFKALKLSNSSTPSKKTASRKKNNSSKGVSTSASPPEKINWVLSGPGGLIWSAFMDESIVPESEKQKWSETFITTLQDRNF